MNFSKNIWQVKFFYSISSGQEIEPSFIKLYNLIRNTNSKLKLDYLFYSLKKNKLKGIVLWIKLSHIVKEYVGSIFKENFIWKIFID